jgi:HSP20 family molecular chaperone IbpA
LKVTYKKPSVESNPSDVEAPQYLHRGIARRSFDMGWKVSPDYNLSDLDATLENGLLQITVPKSESAKAKFIEIK